MAIDDTGGNDRERSAGGTARFDDGVTVGEYSWSDFRREEHSQGRFDRSKYLGFDPRNLPDRLEGGASIAKGVDSIFEDHRTSGDRGNAVGAYGWEQFKQEYYYNSSGNPPRGSEFDASEYLGWDASETQDRVDFAQGKGEKLAEVIDQRTVDVNDEIDEDEFFTTRDGTPTVVNRYDLEKTVPMEKKSHFMEEQRYWVNKPYACVIIFKSQKENEIKYYVIEPHLNQIENDLEEFLSQKLKTAIKYTEDDVIVQGDEQDRAEVIEREAESLLRRYDLFTGERAVKKDNSGGGLLGSIKGVFGGGDDDEEWEELPALDGVEARPEPNVLQDDPKSLNEYQVEKLLYMLKRDFIGYALIDPIKHDINVEDISCDGYNSRVFVYHTDYEQIISNIEHGKDDLDDFVVKLAQRSGKGISKRQPQVDATLPDGSRAQLTLGAEVSDHGTNYTIRQFKDVPFTPVDLINWNTFNLDEMAFLWLCIENHKSLIFAGGTASGKTTSLNAISLFIPSNAKIVSIEDTREVELPQRNWVASVTRPSFGEDDKGDVDEFDLLEAALRQRPDYIVMGEIRGEEGRVLFQVMSTGHTTYTTFHADTVGEVIKRFTTDPINVSKTLFTALDLVSIQTQTRVGGHKVRRNKKLTEINEYSPENDEINVRDVYEWRAETDQFLQMGSSSTLEDIKFDRGWTQDRLDKELFKRKVVLAYLIENDLNTYTEVAATVQAFINDPDTILAIISQGQLERSLEDLREMESVSIDVDQEKEELVPRPEPPEEMLEETDDILRSAEPMLEQYREKETGDLVSALAGDNDDAGTVQSEDEDIDFGQFVPKAGAEAED
jgi:flagellar protein FlaI